MRSIVCTRPALMEAGRLHETSMITHPATNSMRYPNTWRRGATPATP